MSIFAAHLATVAPSVRTIPITVRGESAPRTDAQGGVYALRVQSPETPAVAKAMHAFAEATTALSQDEAMTAVCVAAVVGWHLVNPDGSVVHVDCTPETRREYFDAARWAREPVMTALAEIDAFFGNAGSASSPASAGT